MKILRHLVAIGVLPFVVINVVPRWLARAYGVSWAWPESLLAAFAVVTGVAVASVTAGV